MSRFVPGDIVEIETPRGLAYVHVTHDHPSYPQVVRALPGLDPRRPELAQISAMEPRFVTIAALAADEGTSRRKAGRAPGPAAERRLPTCKMEIREKIDGAREEIAYWWFWDGEGLTYDTAPSEEMRKLPTREVISAARLVERILAAEADA